MRGLNANAVENDSNIDEQGDVFLLQKGRNDLFAVQLRSIKFFT